MPWHTCCDPVTLAAPYVIDLHHDTVARDQLAHLAEVLHEYLEKSPGVVDSAWVRRLLALEPGTELLFYPDGPSKPALTMRLEPGDVLLFRGDCWHAGAGYTTKNRRMHFYLSSPMRRREAGRTWFYEPKYQ